MPERVVVPMSYGDVLDWAGVARNPAGETTLTRYVLSHARSGSNGPTATQEIILHLQGFVQKVNLHPLGDWNPR